MRTKLSTKGQIVVPTQLRTRLGLQAGDSLDVEIEGDCIVLRPPKAPKGKARIIKDPVSGFPVLDTDDDVPPLTSEQVDEILADFP
jgi:AbrB family looped-hinge helix DNA binding protein